jgi:hypothetical protein
VAVDVADDVTGLWFKGHIHHITTDLVDPVLKISYPKYEKFESWSLSRLSNKIRKHVDERPLATRHPKVPRTVASDLAKGDKVVYQGTVRNISTNDPMNARMTFQDRSQADYEGLEKVGELDEENGPSEVPAGNLQTIPPKVSTKRPAQASSPKITKKNTKPETSKPVVKKQKSESNLAKMICFASPAKPNPERKVSDQHYVQVLEELREMKNDIKMLNTNMNTVRDNMDLMAGQISSLVSLLEKNSEKNFFLVNLSTSALTKNKTM